MKKNDWITIVLVSGTAFIICTLIGGSFVNTDKKRQTQVEDIKVFSNSFPAYDQRVFNDKSLDPTRDITINNQDSKDPFKNKGN
jgi:hypothetical protein